MGEQGEKGYAKVGPPIPTIAQENVRVQRRKVGPGANYRVLDRLIYGEREPDWIGRPRDGPCF